MSRTSRRSQTTSTNVEATTSSVPIAVDVRNADAITEPGTAGASKKQFLARLKERMHQEDEDGQPPPEITRTSTELQRCEELGRGGLGVVFEFQDKDLNRVVALKVARRECLDSPGRLARFVREYSLTSRLQHPAIPPVYGIGQLDDGRPYYVMRLVRGETLSRRIDKFHRSQASIIDRGDDQFEAILSAFLMVCDAIQFAHESQVIHRDIKPDNVVIESDNTTFVVDWGLARENRSEEQDNRLTEPIAKRSPKLLNTLDDQHVGSPAWMAPEQAAGDIKLHDESTDIYGLGATLFHILTGRPPHFDAAKARLSGESQEAWAKLIVDNPTPPALSKGMAIPAELASICAIAMSAQQEARYSSAAELKADVQRWLRRDTVIAHLGKYSAADRLGRWASRHAKTLAATILSLGIVTVICAVATMAIAHASRRESAALAKEQETNATMLTALENVTDATLKAEVLSSPDLQPFREELLSQVIENYEEWTATRSSDQKDVARAASGLEMVAKIHQETARPEAALEVCKLADDLWREIALVGGDRRLAYASFLRLYADILRQNEQLAYAETKSLAAVAIVRDCRTSVMSQRELAACLDVLRSVRFSQAESASEWEKREDWLRMAEELSSEAVAIRTQLFDSAADVEAELDLATALSAAGIVAHKRGKHTEALVCYRLALDHTQNLRISAAPGSEMLRRANQSEVKIRFNQGMTYRGVGQIDKAVQTYERGIALCEQLVREHPLFVRFQAELARGYGNLADTLSDSADTVPELLARKQTIALNWELANEFPTIPMHADRAALHTIRLCRTLHDLERDAECARELTNLLDRYPEPELVEEAHFPQRLSAAICFAATASQQDSPGKAQRFFNRSMEIITHELQHGMLDDCECYGTFFQDDALAPIRESQEIIDLIVKYDSGQSSSE